MLPIAFLEHELPGRMRLRVPSMRGDPSFFQNAVRDLADRPFIHALRVNPDTGSILISHSGDTDAIRASAAERGIFDLRLQESGRLPDPCERAADGGAVEPSLLNAAAAALVGLGVYQIVRGDPLGTATESFWHAYAAHRFLKSPLLASALLGLGLIQFLRGHVLGTASALLFYALMIQHLAELPAATDNRPEDAPT